MFDTQLGFANIFYKSEQCSKIHSFMKQTTNSSNERCKLDANLYQIIKPIPSVISKYFDYLTKIQKNEDVYYKITINEDNICEILKNFKSRDF